MGKLKDKLKNLLSLSIIELDEVIKRNNNSLVTLFFEKLKQNDEDELNDINKSERNEK